MKKLILLALVSLSAFAMELKVTTLSTHDVNYQNGAISGGNFRILCINGYQWLQFGINTGSVSQMFDYDNNLQRTMPIRCKN